MVTLDLKYSRLKDLLGKDISLKELEFQLFEMGMELEYEADDLKVDITPDRIDMLSPQGLARSLRAYLGIKKGLPNYRVKKSNLMVIVESSVFKVRPYTACVLVKNLRFNDDTIKEMIWIQEKLHTTYGRNRKRAAIGIYPFEDIKSPIKYLAEDPAKIFFRPLESNLELNGYDILKKYKEYAYLLSGEKKYPIFKDANNQILSMPPIINSHKLGRVTEKTRDIFIECSGLELKPLKELINIFAVMFADMGGEIYSVEVKYDWGRLISPDLKPEKRNLRFKDIEGLLGVCPKNFKELLERMMYNVISFDKNKIVLEAPAFRVDLWHDVNIKEFQHLSLKESTEKTINMVRVWLIPDLLRALHNNRNREYPQDIFEINYAIKYDEDSEVKSRGVLRLAVTLCHEKANFTMIKQILDSLMDALDLSYVIKETKHSSFIEGRVGRVCVANKEVAYIGEIHPQVLINFDLNYPVAALELNLTELLECSKSQ